MLYAGFADALKGMFWIEKSVEEIDISKPENLANVSAASQPTDINIWLSPPQLPQSFQGTQVMWGIFESDRLPPSYLSDVTQFVDLVWTPSAWAKKVLIGNGVDPKKIDVVPWAVDCSLFHPFLREPADAVVDLEDGLRFFDEHRVSELEDIENSHNLFSGTILAQIIRRHIPNWPEFGMCLRIIWKTTWTCDERTLPEKKGRVPFFSILERLRSRPTAAAAHRPRRDSLKARRSDRRR